MQIGISAKERTKPQTLQRLPSSTDIWFVSENVSQSYSYCLLRSSGSLPDLSSFTKGWAVIQSPRGKQTGGLDRDRRGTEGGRASEKTSMRWGEPHWVGDVLTKTRGPCCHTTSLSASHCPPPCSFRNFRLVLSKIMVLAINRAN